MRPRLVMASTYCPGTRPAVSLLSGWVWRSSLPTPVRRSTGTHNNGARPTGPHLYDPNDSFRRSNLSVHPTGGWIQPLRESRFRGDPASLFFGA